MPNPWLMDTDWVRARYFEGLTHREIAQRAGCSASAVTYALRRSGIWLDRAEYRRVPELADPEWLAAQYPRRSATDIASELEVTCGAVINALRRHDINLAPHGQHRRNRLVYDQEWLLARRDEGLTRAQIATLAGCSVSTVAYAVRQLGLQQRV